MVKVSLRIDKRYKLSDGKYPVKLTIARKGKTLYIPLGVSVEEKNWDATSLNHIKNLPQRKMLNTCLNRQLSQAELSIQELQAKGLLRTFTNKQLIDYLSIDRKANKKKDDELFLLVERAFAQRRKSLINNLKGCYDISEEKLQEAGLDRNVRAEQMSWEDFSRLYEVLK